MNHHLRFRQVHLDFHTSGLIPGIGLAFDADEWKRTLKNAHVNSITLFAKCHHGWHYHETKVGRMHPNLGFDLLRAQFDACKEIGVNAPIYISAGLDDATVTENPGWKNIYLETETMTPRVPSPFRAGFHRACFNSPYVDYLVKEVQEVLEQFPNCDGIFTDITTQPVCVCEHCMKVMRDNGLDPHSLKDLNICRRMAQQRYFKMITDAVMEMNPEMPLYHNGGVKPSDAENIKKYYSHLELESLPTGGWGYDHFPMAAKYAKTLGLDFLGMTGKFHTTWGEFGGYKHPNALRYECAHMLAYGAKCSIGDQLHPCGKLDSSTYRIIGKAYAEVEAKEPWCDNVENVAEIAIIPEDAVLMDERGNVDGDIGAGRILLEGHFLFDVIGLDADFSKYKLLILPDTIKIDKSFKKKLDAYLAAGGRLLLTGKSGLDKDGKPVFELGAKFEGDSPNPTEYILPNKELLPEDIDSPMVVYLRGQRLKVSRGKSLGKIFKPYFNRTDHYHFCSHQQTPYVPEPTEYDIGVQNGGITYLAHPIFSMYKGWGAVPIRQFICNVIRLALGAEPRLTCNMPSAARVSMMHQPAENRSVIHLLYANIQPRGGSKMIGDVYVSGNGQIIEELLPLADTTVKVKPLAEVTGVTLEPQGLPLQYHTDSKGNIKFRVDSFTCHQMVVLHY